MKRTSYRTSPTLRFLFSAFLLACMCMHSASCARAPVVVTPKKALDYGQFVVREVPEDIDLETLEGKRIVIDPGHGGDFKGAVGPNNLAESDVNLGVGLYLWGMLKQAGAEPVLTRVADSNVYKGEDFDLKKDLQARVELAEEYQAELFVSLHHNADVLPSKKKNSLETYFKMSDPGPSLDLARSIHRHLAISLDQTDNMISPGNFHVLRENSITAVLGEPSYITHEGNEFRLGLGPMQRIEAQAYFLGIAEYFSKGVPVVEDIRPNGIIDDPNPLITASVVADRNVPIDPGSVEMLIDGEPVDARFDPIRSQVTYLPPERLDNGKHNVRISLRNVNGNGVRPVEQEMEIALPPAYVLLEANAQSIRPGSPVPIRLRARVLDVDLVPVADGTRVEFRAEGGVVAPSEVLTRKGFATAYLTPAGEKRSGEISAFASASNVLHSLKVNIENEAPEQFGARTLDQRTGLPVENVLVSVDDRLLGYTDMWGYMAAPKEEIGDGSVVFSRSGYRSHRFSSKDTMRLHLIKLTPIANGILFNQRFVLDPEFGGELKGAIGPTGLRASDLNLDVARYLAQFLRASGAEVALTRSSDETLTPLRRVEIAEAFGPNWFISVGHSGTPAEVVSGSEDVQADVVPLSASVMHYPRSELGLQLAASIAELMRSREIAGTVGPQPATDFVLTHTSCPAVIVRGPNLAVPDVEERFRYPRAAREEAYAIYCGVLEAFGLTDANTGGFSATVVDEEGNTVPGTLLTLDGAIVLESDAGGAFCFSRLVAGEHELDVYAKGRRLWNGKVRVEAGSQCSLDTSLSGLSPPESPSM